MDKSYFQIKDSQRTAWFTSEKILKLAPAAALFSKVAGASPKPDISTVEQCAGADLRPIPQSEFDAGRQELVSSFHDGLVAEIDLNNGQSSFVYWGMFRDTVYRVDCPINELAGIYDAAFDKVHGKLNSPKFIDALGEHCTWEAVSGLAAETERQEQKPPQQGMTMS